MNPFLATDFKINWSSLTPNHIEADVTKAIELGRKNIEAIKAITPESASYDNTFGALETATEDLDRAWGRVNHLDSVANSDELREALNKMLPVVSEFSSAISLDADLWQVLKNFADSKPTLTEIKQRFVDETVADFKAAGADLEPAAKKRMAELNAELAQVTQKFGENVLDSTNAWELFIEDEARLAGLPASSKAAAAEEAKAKGKEGQFRFTQQFPSMYPVMQYLTLQRRMAREGKSALKFTEDLHARIEDRFHAETKELQSYKAEKAGSAPTPLEPWETAYWAEKRRKELYDLDDEALRPYFPVEQVMEGLFTLTSRLFGIKISPAEADAWHEEVSFYAPPHANHTSGSSVET